jgi:hypothetical protein
MTVLKCTSPRGTINVTHNFPLIGETSFDENACISIEDDKVETFLNIKCGFEFVKLDSEGKEIVPVETNPEKAAYKEELEKLHINEINALIETHEYNETKGLKKVKDKITFLVNKQYPA